MSKTLNELFEADFMAGTLTWMIRPRECFAKEMSWKTWNNRYAGSAAGCFDGRYWLVGIHGRKHMVHRILFEMGHGPIPDGMDIDHIDGNTRNNTLSNLRVATRSQNMMNTGKPTHNTSGHKGVSLHSRFGKFRAQIKVAGKYKHLGYFADIKDAIATYEAASVIHYGSFARH